MLDLPRLKTFVPQRPQSTEEKGNSQNRTKNLLITYLLRESYPEYIENS